MLILTARVIVLGIARNALMQRCPTWSYETLNVFIRKSGCEGADKQRASETQENSYALDSREISSHKHAGFRIVLARNQFLAAG